MDLKKAIKHQELKDLMEKKQQKGHHELALEIGLEALQISEEWQIYRDMGCSSLKLGRFEDAIKFFKKQLKLLVKIKDAGVLQNLSAYKNLIDAQCRAKDYHAAMKTCNKIKMFNLYSQNIHDVPLKNLLSRFTKENMQDLSFQMKMERYLTYQVSVWICLSKAEIFTALDNPTLACHWLDEIQKSFQTIWTQERMDLGPKELLVASFQNSSREITRASWLVKSFSDCGPYCTKNEGKLPCGQPTICKLVQRILTVGIVCWDKFGSLRKNMEEKISTSTLRHINKAIFYSPFSEDKVMLFINHLIETSLDEDVKKKIIRYKNSMMINRKLQLTLKKLENLQNFCENHGINRRKAINLTAYFN